MKLMQINSSKLTFEQLKQLIEMLSEGRSGDNTLDLAVVTRSLAKRNIKSFVFIPSPS